MSTQVFHLEHLSPQTSLCVALYKDVKNAALLQQQLLAGNQLFEYAFIDASVIAESFRRFGIQPTTTNLLVMKVDTMAQPAIAAEAQEHLSTAIEGEQVAFEDEVLRVMTDLDKVRKIYKLPRVGGGGKGSRQIESLKSEQEIQQLEVLAMGCMAVRGATN